MEVDKGFGYSCSITFRGKILLSEVHEFKCYLSLFFSQANLEERGTESFLQGHLAAHEQGLLGRRHHLHDLRQLHGDVQQDLAVEGRLCEGVSSVRDQNLGGGDVRSGEVA